MTDFASQEIARLTAERDRARIEVECLRVIASGAKSQLVEARAERDASAKLVDNLTKTLELCRFSIRNENHVTGNVKDDWLSMIDAALAAGKGVSDDDQCGDDDTEFAGYHQAPPKLFVREAWGSLANAIAAGEVVGTEVAGYYARRGSHWIRYVRADLAAGKGTICE